MCVLSKWWRTLQRPVWWSIKDEILWKVARVFILSSFNKLKETNSVLIVKLVEKITGFCGISASSVCTTWEQNLKLQTDGLHQVRNVDVNKWSTYMTFWLKTTIRRKVHGQFFQNELLTMDKFLQCANLDHNVPKFSRFVLYGPYTFKFSVSEEYLSLNIHTCSKRILWTPQYDQTNRVPRYDSVATNNETAATAKHVEVPITHAAALAEPIRYRRGRKDTFVAAC